MTQVRVELSTVWHTTMAVPLSLLLWLMVYTLGYILIEFLNILRDQGGDLLQVVFRQLIAPAVGGYAAIVLTSSWLPRTNLTTLFWCFCIPVLVFMVGAPIIMIAFFSEGSTFSWVGQVFRWLGGATTVMGAVLARRHVAL